VGGGEVEALVPVDCLVTLDIFTKRNFNSMAPTSFSIPQNFIRHRDHFVISHFIGRKDLSSGDQQGVLFRIDFYTLQKEHEKRT